MAYSLIKEFPITLDSGFEISPGSIATGPNRIYIPAKSDTESKMFVFDYGCDENTGLDNGENGKRIIDEEFELPFTRGISYGGATYYSKKIWVVSNEQIENKFMGCIEAYDPESKPRGKKTQGITLPWMWGAKEFQVLGITIEDGNFYILTKRRGWIKEKERKGDYKIEWYDTGGNLKQSYDSFNIVKYPYQTNLTPIGLTDKNMLFFIGDIDNNKAYSYDNEFLLNNREYLLGNQDFILDNQDFDFEDNNTLNNNLISTTPTDQNKGNPHGIGYNGASFSVLRYPNLLISIYTEDTKDGKNNKICSIDDIDPIGQISHGASLVTDENKQFSGLGKYGRQFKIESSEGVLKQWKRNRNKDNETIENKMVMLFGPSVDFLTSTNLESGLFKSVDYVKFIPQYTFPGLELGDIIIPDEDIPESNSSREILETDTKFEIIDFKEGGSGRIQTIYTKRIG